MDQNFRKCNHSQNISQIFSKKAISGDIAHPFLPSCGEKYFSIFPLNLRS